MPPVPAAFCLSYRIPCEPQSFLPVHSLTSSSCCTLFTRSPLYPLLNPSPWSTCWRSPLTSLESAQACVFVLLVYLAASVRALIVGLFCWRSYPPVRLYLCTVPGLTGGRSGTTTRARARLFVVLPRGQRVCPSCRQFVGGVALQSLHCNTCHVTTQTVVEEVE